ncbi:MAG: hypothetical protein CMB99_15300 [Flavobacteriaceae bacterium]|nr:hypothetical protein [Flavobacteriaceae bacterium]|tara:strand:+ start:368732 stop:369808 length:1077 start_codon:yes stop_codon:yes gene_type:complete
MKNRKRHLVFAILLPIQIGLVQYLSNYQSFIENYYANGVYPFLSKSLRFLLGWVPFSIGDALLFVFVLLFFRFIFLLIKTKFKDFFRKFIEVAAFLSILHFCFYFFWGMNYFREPLQNQFEFDTSNYSTEELVKTTSVIIERANDYHQQLTANDSLVVEVPYTRKQMYGMAVQGYGQLSADHPQFQYEFASVKHSMMSLLQSYNGTSGYLNPITGEAHINNKIPKTGYPTTVCHEMAHQIGFAAENEANFIGFLAAKSHDDPYFKYASYRMALAYCLNELRKRDAEKYAEKVQLIHKGILEDYNRSSRFWRQFKNPLEPLMKKGYNAYLKANRQEKGIASYNYVVDLLISYHKYKGSI